MTKTIWRRLVGREGQRSRTLRRVRAGQRLAAELLESRDMFNVAPLAPTINEPNVGALVDFQSVHMEAGPFSDADAGDTHTATQWELWTTGAGAERVWLSLTGTQLDHAHLPDGSFEGSYTGRTELKPSTNYQLRVRFRDSSGDAATEWSPFSTRTFDTISGFTSTTVVSGLTSPITMDIAPDGRVFVAFQNGVIRVMVNDVMLPTPFATLACDGSGERGLQGLELDPDFMNNGHMYVYYTATSPSSHNRVSRLTADPLNPNVMAAGGETVLLDLPLFSSLPQNQSPIWHMGGAIHVAPDGTLRVQTGDHLNNSLVQNVDTMIGKVLRLNTDGTVPTDNPFYTAGTITARDYVWALGLRNPYSGDIDPVTGQYLIGDVGEGSWEEINDATLPGRNFGWPSTEGTFNQATYPNFTQPLLAYSHSEDSAITGGVFYNPPVSQFPSQYQGKFFYSQFTAGRIRYIDPANPSSPQTFLTGQSYPMNLEVSPDGSLYFIARGAGAGGAPGTGTGKIIKVQYVANLPPAVLEHPDNTLVSVGYDATFDASVQGSAPLSYQWQRKNSADPGFADIPGATSATYTLAAAPITANGAQFRLVVTNNFGTATSNPATLTVTTALPPVATITSPVNGTLYQGGDTFTFSGSGFDNEDGSLPAASMTWWIDFHHDTHTHPFMAPTTGISSGQFTIPSVSETAPNVWYRVYLRVVDSMGLAHQTFTDVLPRKANYTIATNIPGLTLNLDNHPHIAPYTFEGVVNLQRSLDAPIIQTLNGVTYQFVSWSDGGAATHNIMTPAINTTYTATYQVAPWIYLSNLPFVGTPTNGWGPVERDRSNGETGAADGRSLSLRGQTYAKGLGAHANGSITFDLGDAYDRFLSDIGIDDETNGNGSAVFQVYADNVLIYQSSTLTGTSPITSIDVSVAGVQQLRLVVNDAGNGNGSDHTDWANARLTAIPPGTPVLSATALAANQVALSWTNVANETGYRIERSPSGIDRWESIGNLSRDITTYLDTTAAPLSPNYYRVIATGPLAEASSNIVQAITSDVIRINFQTDNAPDFPGYFRDIGVVYADRGNGYSYGWNQDISAHARYRQAANSPDLRYDTFNHLQKPGNETAAWEIAVPNGQYAVHFVSGDPSNFDGFYVFNIEGVVANLGAPTSAQRWREATVNVTVNDGKLTIGNGPNSSNNKLNFVDINPIPTANFVDVSPDPRNVPVDSIVIEFSEPISGFNLTDLTLSRDGGPNLLTAGQSLSSADNQHWTLSGLSALTTVPGSYVLSLTAAGSGIVDAAGASLSASVTETFVVAAPAPTVTNITPVFGPTTGGTIVLITGTNFVAGAAVHFGTTAATNVIVNSSTQITATSPVGTGVVDVRVTTSGGQSAIAPAGQFTYRNPPTLVSTVLNGNDPQLLNLPTTFANQRSMVRSVRLTFDNPVTLTPAAISLAIHANPLVPSPTLPETVSVLNSSGGTGLDSIWNVTFSGASIIGGSLADGEYDLNVIANQVTDAFGQHPLANPATFTFYRLFGDADGNRTVNTVDIVNVRLEANTTQAAPDFTWLFDADWNGTINNLDIIAARRNSGRAI
jgi:glucose/arabinose dehydrogenase